LCSPRFTRIEHSRFRLRAERLAVRSQCRDFRVGSRRLVTLIDLLSHFRALGSGRHPAASASPSTASTASTTTTAGSADAVVSGVSADDFATRQISVAGKVAALGIRRNAAVIASRRCALRPARETTPLVMVEIWHDTTSLILSAAE